jgi:hypothetical protein
LVYLLFGKFPPFWLSIAEMATLIAMLADGSLNYESQVYGLEIMCFSRKMPLC